jgi:hypothetical protein
MPTAFYGVVSAFGGAPFDTPFETLCEAPADRRALRVIIPPNTGRLQPTYIVPK